MHSLILWPGKLAKRFFEATLVEAYKKRGVKDPFTPPPKLSPEIELLIGEYLRLQKEIRRERWKFIRCRWLWHGPLIYLAGMLVGWTGGKIHKLYFSQNPGEHYRADCAEDPEPKR